MTDPRNRPSWIFGAVIPAIYVTVELAFNHQLTNIAADTVSDDILAGLEFWGRMISGLGLGLLIYRLSLIKLKKRVIGLIVCLSFGVIVMWNLQRELTQYLVNSADPADKSAAVALSVLAPDAAAGSLKTLKGESMVADGITSIEQKSVMTLFPAAALHAENRVNQINAWLDQRPKNSDIAPAVPFTPENAYKNLIVPPIALGLSILFALLNLSLLIAFVFEVFYKKYQIILRGAAFGMLLIFTFQHPKGFIDTEGYRNSLREGLWQNKPLLALLVEWSGAASSAWGAVSEASSQMFLLGYSFRKPGWVRF